MNNLFNCLKVNIIALFNLILLLLVFLLRIISVAFESMVSLIVGVGVVFLIWCVFELIIPQPLSFLMFCAVAAVFFIVALALSILAYIGKFFIFIYQHTFMLLYKFFHFLSCYIKDKFHDYISIYLDEMIIPYQNTRKKVAIYFIYYIYLLVKKVLTYISQFNTVYVVFFPILFVFLFIQWQNTAVLQVYGLDYLNFLKYLDLYSKLEFGVVICCLAFSGWYFGDMIAQSLNEYRSYIYEVNDYFNFDLLNNPPIMTREVADSVLARKTMIIEKVKH